MKLLGNSDMNNSDDSDDSLSSSAFTDTRARSRSSRNSSRGKSKAGTSNMRNVGSPAQFSVPKTVASPNTRGSQNRGRPASVGGRFGRKSPSAALGANPNDSISDDDDDQSSVLNRSVTSEIQRTRQRRLAEGGLNSGERPTSGRLRNPSKYTDKSMYTNLDRSPAVGVARRRIAEGLPHEVTAICTNKLGKVRMCKQLLTPMNFRRLYLRLDFKIPRNLLMALTVDVSDKRLRTLDARDVTTYYYHTAMYLLSSLTSNDDEILDSDLAVNWLMNAVQILNRLDSCVGETTMSDAIEQKYGRAIDMEPGTLGGMVRRTIVYTGYHNKRSAIELLKQLADQIKPTGIRIWGIDDNLGADDSTPRYNENVFLGEARKNEVRVYPLAEQKSYVRNVRIDDDA